MNFPIQYTFFSKKSQSTGRLHKWLDHPELAKFFSEPLEGQKEKDSLPLWSAARFEGNQRSNQRVNSAGLLCFDIDRPFRFFGPFCQSVVSALGSCLVHTTFGSENEKLKARLVLPLSRPVTREEYVRLWLWGFDRLKRAGLEGDPSTKDPARMWFVPARPPSGIYYFFISPSLESLAVDDVLTEIQANAAASLDASPSRQPQRASRATAPSTAYIKSALRRGANEVRLTMKGTRHNVLRDEAYSLTRFLGKGLDENTLIDELMSAARDVGLPEEEMKRVLEDSIRHRRRVQ